MELVLSTMVIGSASIVGLLIARPFHNRVLHLQELITCFRILEAEMKYRQDPLPKLFLGIGPRFQGPAGQLFLQAGRCLSSNPMHDFYTDWCLAVQEIYGGGSLSDLDKDVLCEVGLALGKTDLENQQSLFHRVFTRLDQQVALAESEKMKKGRVYRSLCTAAGVVLVIVLL